MAISNSKKPLNLYGLYTASEALPLLSIPLYFNPKASNNQIFIQSLEQTKIRQFLPFPVNIGSPKVSRFWRKERDSDELVPLQREALVQKSIGDPGVFLDLRLPDSPIIALSREDYIEKLRVRVKTERQKLPSIYGIEISRMIHDTEAELFFQRKTLTELYRKDRRLAENWANNGIHSLTISRLDLDQNLAKFAEDFETEQRLSSSPASENSTSAEFGEIVCITPKVRMWISREKYAFIQIAEVEKFVYNFPSARIAISMKHDQHTAGHYILFCTPEETQLADQFLALLDSDVGKRSIVFLDAIPDNDALAFLKRRRSRGEVGIFSTHGLVPAVLRDVVSLKVSIMYLAEIGFLDEL